MAWQRDDGQQYFGQNHVYTPTGGSFIATTMQNNAASIAGVQAMSDQLYQPASVHIATLQGLRVMLPRRATKGGAGIWPRADGADLHRPPAGRGTGGSDCQVPSSLK